MIVAKFKLLSGKTKVSQLNGIQNLNSDNNLPHITKNKNSLTNTELLKLYEQILSMSKYEGNGIWSRFNILIGINISFVAGIALILNGDNVTKESIIIIKVLCVIGFIFSIWSLDVLRRLWKYHKHWINMLKDVEAKLPSDCVKMVSTFSAQSTIDFVRKEGFLNDWFLSKTQLFFVVFVLFWIFLFIVSYNLSFTNP